jgi:uncharacterized membrane protein
MEDSNNLFSLSVDPVSKSHLAEASKWARFLAITGMITLVLLVLAGFYLATQINKTSNDFGGQGFETNAGIAAAMGTGIVVMYIIMAVIWFFPLLFLLRFANQARTAVNSNNQEQLNSAFQNLKICFRYVGIVTIIGIGFYLVAFLISISSGQGVSF